MPAVLAHEIASQPATVERLLDRETDHIAAIIAALPPCDYALIAARGSSDHAATYAKYAWAALAGVPVALAAPSLFTLYARPPRLAGALVVGISQSGESPDIIAVLDEGRRQGRPTVAVTNEGDSPLARAADHVVRLHAGPERSVAATKTYTAELAVIAAFAAAWSGSAQRQAELRAVPEALAATLAATLAGGDAVARLATRYARLDSMAVIARGYNYATAFEIALKLKELTYVAAAPYSAADFRHGPIATIATGSAALLVLADGPARGDLLELAADLRERGTELLVVAAAPEALALAQTPLPFASGVPEWLSPLVAVIPGQQLALRLALAKGLDPDAPRGLRKVTRTR